MWSLLYENDFLFSCTQNSFSQQGHCAWLHFELRVFGTRKWPLSVKNFIYIPTLLFSVISVEAWVFPGTMQYDDEEITWNCCYKIMLYNHQSNIFGSTLMKNDMNMNHVEEREWVVKIRMKAEKRSFCEARTENPLTVCHGHPQLNVAQRE